MELSWLMKLRIAGAFVVGMILIGFLGWPLAGVSEPFMAVSLSSGTITFTGAVIVIALAFSAGLLAYFLCWPYGSEIAILAAPAGLAVWTMRCGNMTDLMLLNPTLSQRQQFFAALKWEPFFWLAVVAAGYCGILLAQRIQPKKQPDNAPEKSQTKKGRGMYLNAVIALIGSLFIAQLCVRIFAQDIRFDPFVAQPALGQIVFAVLASFAVTAFIVKKFLDVGYIWPIIASALITGFVSVFYINQTTLQQLVERCPAAFFHNPVISVLPIQMVAFGTLGSVAGYWMAVRYNYWRKHGI